VNAPELVRRVEDAGGVLKLHGNRIQYELPEDALPLLDVLREHREEVLLVLRQRARQQRCYVHGTETSWWTRADGSQVCGKCDPDPYVVAIEKTAQGAPPPMPRGVKLIDWKPKCPPVAIETWMIVNDVPKFVQATLEQLQAALAGKAWLAGNWSVRELVDRLEQVGVKVMVTI
jgi:hypothetical protein